MVHPGYRKRTITLLFGILLIRFWFGQTFELSGQEAYLWLQGHGNNLSPAYWERGPFVPLLIRIGTMFFGDTELGVRWLGAWICCCTGFVLFYLARHWFTARVAFWTAVLFIVVPMYAWKLSFMTEASASVGLMALALFAFSHAVEEDRVWWWLLGGAACGMGLLVALSNAWWLAGLLLYFAVSPARHARLQEALLWSTVVFTSLFLFPIIWWWREPQVSDVIHAHLLNAWPLSHPFSFHRGFEFIWKELFYFSLPLDALLVFLLVRLGREALHDARFGLMICMALPGLLWENFSAFFQEGRFELMPALFLPLLLLVGCSLATLSPFERRLRWAYIFVFWFAAVQSLAGLNPFYISAGPDGQGYEIRRATSGENVTGFSQSKRQLSWRNTADELERLQKDQGATLIITDSPTTASALSFYLPHNQFVYVKSSPDVITHFDFWPLYDDSASPNDSALYITHTNDPPPADLVKDFASVTPVDITPQPDFDKSWNIWDCQKFIAPTEPAAGNQPRPLPDSDALPK